MRAMMWALSLAALCAAVPGARADERSDRLTEANLLHGQVAFSGLSSYSRDRGSWQPLRQPTARVLVVNLWSRTCPPCLAELPIFSELVAQWRRRDSRNVQFLFVADPPTENSAAEVAQFWQSPFADQLAGKACPGTNMARGKQPSCLLTVPAVDPVRGASTLLAGATQVDSRPLTLLVDDQGTIRQVFAGSIVARQKELAQAIDRLSSAVQRRPGGR